jgi:hypothetical protein
MEKFFILILGGILGLGGIGIAVFGFMLLYSVDKIVE